MLGRSSFSGYGPYTDRPDTPWAKISGNQSVASPLGAHGANFVRADIYLCFANRYAPHGRFFPGPKVLFRPKFQEHKAISVRIHWGIAKKQVSVLATYDSSR